MIAYAVHPERFVRKTPEPPVLPDAVWINPPKKPSASQEGAGATISIADDHRVELNMEGFGVASESTGNVRHPVAAPTHEVLHEMPTASVPNSLPRSARWLVKTSVLYASPPPSPEDQTRVSHFQLIEFWVERPAINSFFLNKLREVGCIHYKSRMEAHSPLLDIALHD